MKKVFCSWAQALSLILVASSLVACGSKVQNRTDTLVVAIPTAPQDLDPRRATDAVSMRLTGLMFQSIVKLGPELTIVGEAAESWKRNKLKHIFHLKPGLKFTNGNPITAEDIEYSFSEFRQSTNPFSTSFQTIDNVKVESQDDHLVVTVTLKKPTATLLIDLTVLKILPADYSKQVGIDFGHKPIGSGPFELASRGVNEIVLRRRADDPAAAATENIVFKVVRDDNTRYLKMRKGEVDLVQVDMPLSKVKEFRTSPNYVVDQRPGLSMAYMLVNHQDKDLSQLAVRKAFDLAIDRKSLITYKLEGLGLPATSLLIPEDSYHNPQLTPSMRDLKKAKEWLAKAKLTRRKFILKCSNNGAAVENARVIANQLSELGLEVSVQSYEWGTYYDDIKKGNFDLATMRWIGVSDPDIYRLAFHSREFPPGRNRGRYRNLALDNLLDTAGDIEDESQRRQAYNKIQQIVYDDLAIIPLWYDLQVTVRQKNVQNYTLSLYGDFSPLTKVLKQ